MTQVDVDTKSLGEVAPGPGRFGCPSCGSMLRTGAILCPHCDTDLWTMARGGPAPSPEEAHSSAAAVAPRPAFVANDGRLGRRSLVLAATALGAKLLLPLMAAAVDQLSWLWSLLGWVTTLVALSAIYLARKAGGRLGGTRDERGPVAAKYGLILGMAALAYVASTFITWSLDQAIGNLHP